MEDFIKEKIKEIAFSSVSNDDLLWTNKILDSITLVELIVEIESEYNIKIEMNEIIVENFETVDLMVKFIQSKLA
jgi:acyl carrier protein